MSKPTKNGEDKGFSKGFLENMGTGRPKGVQNKMTKELRHMIREALDKAGGVEYLARQAEDNPGPFMALVGKILPTKLVGEDDEQLEISIRHFHQPKEKIIDGESEIVQ